jgi:hypothetical protein
MALSSHRGLHTSQALCAEVRSKPPFALMFEQGTAAKIARPGSVCYDFLYWSTGIPKDHA